jgi:protoporphyrinogen oxidase
MDRTGLVKRAEVSDGMVVRVQKAYPIYDINYRRSVEAIRDWLRGTTNLWSAGRSAMHQYNNQDHSMMTALLSARNLMKTDMRDPWMINHEAEYLEERLIPEVAGASR